MCTSHTDFHPYLTINIESTGTTSFMPVNKVWLLLWWSSWNLVTQYNFVVISCTEIYLNQAKNVEDMDKILFMLLSICPYSWILQLLNTIVCRLFSKFHPNQSRSTENMSTNSFICRRKYDCYWADYHKTLACLTLFCS